MEIKQILENITECKTYEVEAYIQGVLFSKFRKMYYVKKHISNHKEDLLERLKAKHPEFTYKINEYKEPF